MTTLSGLERQYVLLLFDQSTRILEAYGENSFLGGYFPELFTGQVYLKDIDWHKNFHRSPSFGGSKVEMLQTINGRNILLLYEHLKEADLWVMIMVSIDDVQTMQSTPIESSQESKQNFLFVSEKMKRIIDIIHQVANVNTTILLLGESGVGKTMLAKMIHEASNRADHPFVSINCGAIPETLIESELFGYEDGAFTGGKRGGKLGLFEEADKGTIFLDEIAELPHNVQVKLLEVLQENKIRKIGSTKSRKINLRIIAATNKDLKEMVDQKLFREDLYYRLNVVPLSIPPLRERKEEIPYLVDHFAKRFNKKYGMHTNIDQETKEKLIHCEWRGNIRELENMVERIIVTKSPEWTGHDHSKASSGSVIEIKELIPLKEAKRILEKDMISRAYKKYKTTYKTAEVLGVDQSTVSKKIKMYNLHK